MYAIYTTPGFIIDSRPRGEGGKLLSIFTRDFGLVLASARGIRLEKSKLRYYAQDYSFGTYSLVRGKEFWRLTSAAGEPASSTFKSDAKTGHFSTSANTLLARLALLLRRLLQGEEANPALFEIVTTLADFIEKISDLNDDQLKTIESLTVLRMLHALGYIGQDAGFDGALESKEFSISLLDRFMPKRALVNQHINKALKESHL